jgi:hypothetical protein
MAIGRPSGWYFHLNAVPNRRSAADGEGQSKIMKVLTWVIVMIVSCFLNPLQGQAQQADPFAIEQIRCSALAAAIEGIPTGDYLDQQAVPGYFTELRRHKPMYNKCMAACERADVNSTCVQKLALRFGVAARFKRLLESSAEDSIKELEGRVREEEKRAKNVTK